ncbi:EF-hand domain [Dillenia turbinata]|uniref:EF-hand domain n=1 Tax=Dillenia turbinata TaxID=194707 RepID=A0AAN8W1K5_9MAGN
MTLTPLHSKHILASMAQLGSLSLEMDTLSHVLSLVEAFRAFDADNDGSITAAELGGIMASLGYNPSEQDVKSMMQQGDTNRDGLLSIEEFLEMNTKDMELGCLARYMKNAFEALDVDENDTITGEDLHEVTANLGMGLSLAACQGIIASMDGDGDGAVSFEDFRLIISSLL